MSGEVSTSSCGTAAPRASSGSVAESDLEGALRVRKLPTLGVALKLLGISRCLNHAQLSLAARTRPASVSSYERSKMRPSIRMIQRLTTSLGYPVAALVRAQEFLDDLARLAACRANPVEVAPDAAPQWDELQREIEVLAQERGRLEARRDSLELRLVAAWRGVGTPTVPEPGAEPQAASEGAAEASPAEPQAPTTVYPLLRRPRPGQASWDRMS